MRSLSLAPLTLLAASLASATPAVRSSSLPQVDLGYEIHQAISFNETGQTYNFTNIRFAQPPVGKLRFKAPVPPTGRNTTVQTGEQLRICPQGLPTWNPIAGEFGEAFIEGEASAFNLTKAEAALAASLKGEPAAAPDPSWSEDCLFLDVLVPKKVYDNRNKGGKKASVLLWIYGGGFVAGSKFESAANDPSGLVKASQSSGDDGIIFVQINYRLGALGWLAGTTLQAAGGVSNAGFYDQRLGIEWVAKYIHLFGGDGLNITVMGESAGAGSILHQITSFGGQKGVSFQGAILQSAGQQPIVSAYQQENATAGFLAELNVSTIAEAQEASSEAVIKANYNQIASSPFGFFTFGPVVDGIFVPALPQTLLSAGAFSKDVKIMCGHNTNEGVYFANPAVRTDAQLEAQLALAWPTMRPEVITHIVKVLYPAIYDGSMPYTSPIERTIFLTTEGMFTCNTNFLARAFGNKTYAYQFAVPPALHGSDIPYTFWNGQPANLNLSTTMDPIVPALAPVLQGYITNFVMTGNPNGAGLPPFLMAGHNATEMLLNATGLDLAINSYAQDPTANARCAYWGLGLYT